MVTFFQVFEFFIYGTVYVSMCGLYVGPHFRLCILAFYSYKKCLR